MAGTRAAPTIVTDPADVTGTAYATRMAAETNNLWNGIITQTTTVAGADTITAVCIPPLIASPVDGQTFRVVPAANNTGAVTFNPDARGAIAVKDENGSALAADDIVANRPIMFWYDATNSYYRLCNPTQQDLLAAMAASIASAMLWEQIGDTTISGAVASIEHTFTANSYSKILVVFSGISSDTNTVLVVTLRHSSGAIVTSSLAVLFNISDVATGQAEFIVDVNSATKRHDGLIRASSGLGPIAEVQATGAHATAPDRVRVSFTANIDAGRIMTYGLKV